MTPEVTVTVPLNWLRALMAATKALGDEVEAFVDREYPPEARYAYAVSGRRHARDMAVVDDARAILADAPALGRSMASEEGNHVHLVWRHKKRRSVYTIIGREWGVVWYVAHADGRRWWRPEAEFWDGRYERSDEPALNMDQLGFERG
jgi:hypothetical protein